VFAGREFQFSGSGCALVGKEVYGARVRRRRAWCSGVGSRKHPTLDGDIASRTSRRGVSFQNG
jgi:hypothetical protein